jgi:hypothetical protein
MGGTEIKDNFWDQMILSRHSNYERSELSSIIAYLNIRIPGGRCNGLGLLAVHGKSGKGGKLTKSAGP